jgi:hypothetical protein
MLIGKDNPVSVVTVSTSGIGLASQGVSVPPEEDPPALLLAPPEEALLEEQAASGAPKLQPDGITSQVGWLTEAPLQAHWSLQSNPAYTAPIEVHPAWHALRFPQLAKSILWMQESHSKGAPTHPPKRIRRRCCWRRLKMMRRWS